MSRPFLIGLTGNIATGKSTVARMLAELGATVIDGDRVARQVMHAGSDTYAAVVAAFGPQIVGSDGELDRQRLGRLVFGDPAAMAHLDAIVHPAVRRQVERLIAAATSDVVVVEAIKLIESGMSAKYNSLWVTTCPAEQQIRRLVRERGHSPAEARQRVAAQSPQEAKIARADVVIHTDSTLARTREQVEAAWEQVVRRL